MLWFSLPVISGPVVEVDEADDTLSDDEEPKEKEISSLPQTAEGKPKSPIASQDKEPTQDVTQQESKDEGQKQTDEGQKAESDKAKTDEGQKVETEEAKIEEKTKEENGQQKVEESEEKKEGRTFNPFLLIDAF